jgi:hypothetical protein
MRLFVMERNRLGAVTQIEKRSDSDGVRVNLRDDSLLSELDREPATRYRVMNYNPRRTEAFHAHGSHVYVMNRQILEADVIVSLPKLKTHEKVGITCALKGFVGAIGHKDSLPHYRFGPPEIGGDECPADKNGLQQIDSTFHGWVQQVAPDRAWGNLLRVMDRSINRVIGPWLPIAEGAWWGNDTAWRMVLDLARIATYATSTGEMQTVPARKHLVFIDGVVGGEGQGPLSPTAVQSGLLLLSDNLVVADYTSALMMGFNPEQIPMMREAIQLAKYPLIKHRLTDEQVKYNGRPSSLSEMGSLAHHHYEPPLGWKGKI